jgi:hypothetical protein
LGPEIPKSSALKTQISRAKDLESQKPVSEIFLELKNPDLLSVLEILLLYIQVNVLKIFTKLLENAII